MNGKVVPKASLNGFSSTDSFANTGTQFINNHSKSISRAKGEFKYDPKLSVAFFAFGYFLSYCGDTAYRQIKKYIQTRKEAKPQGKK